jgi:hypothetical protein
MVTTTPRLPRLAALFALFALSFAASACAGRLDMARAYDAERPAATIPYTGVREETRLYPDYGAIDAAILTEPGEAKRPAGRPKGGKAP